VIATDDNFGRFVFVAPPAPAITTRPVVAPAAEVVAVLPVQRSPEVIRVPLAPIAVIEVPAVTIAAPVDPMPFTEPDPVLVIEVEEALVEVVVAPTEPYYADDQVTLWHGDCLDVLRAMPDASVDSVVTDPPYELTSGKKGGSGIASLNLNSPAGRARISTGFMGNAWDGTGIAFRPDLWAECLRVLKPGGYLLAAGGSRTFHRLASAVEDSGFEIRDCITWHFGSGFPKSRNITRDLHSLPPCSCDVPNQSGTVNTGIPSSLVRAGVGTEDGAVSLTGPSADSTGGVRAQVVPASAADQRCVNVNTLDEQSVGESPPVVLRASTMTSGAESEQICGSVSRVKVDPEALRDEVVRNQAILRAAVTTPPVALDDSSGDGGPLPALVLPRSAAPSGVTVADHAGSVVSGHARPTAVDTPVGPVPERDSADSADMDPVALTSHVVKVTAKRAFRCEVCGGVAGQITEGLGTALKPATEFFTVARKPLIGTVAANVLAFGTGALNVDGCRVATATDDDIHAKNPHTTGGFGHADALVYGTSRGADAYDPSKGRWPTNVLLDESQAAALDLQTGTSVSRTGKPRGAASGEGWGMTATGAEYADSGGPSRFFPTFKYQAKAPTKERPKVDGVAHPTVKPLELMKWLVRLVTPPGGVTLDPFAGSGTSGEAAIAEGFRSILIERDPTYLPLIVKRLDLTIEEKDL